jgi:hypothetical protein
LTVNVTVESTFRSRAREPAIDGIRVEVSVQDGDQVRLTRRAEAGEELRQGIEDALPNRLRRGDRELDLDLHRLRPALDPQPSAT